MRSPYDEVFDNGRPRPAYEATWKTYSRCPRTKVLRNARAAKQCFDRDAGVLTFPRIITRLEYQTLSTGVRQRGRALQLFLQDHYFGDRRYLNELHLGRGFAQAIQRCLRRNDEELSHLILRPENLQFWYSPDIIRDIDGCFRVLEDNVGMVGGMGDLVAIHRAARAIGASRTLLAAQPDSQSFYQEIAAQYLHQARSFGKGLTVMISYAQALCSTHEDRRFESQMARCGITTVRTRRDGRRAHASGTLVEHNGELFLQRSQNKTHDQRVAFVILNVDHADIDPRHRVTMRRFRANRVPDLDPIGTPGFWEAVAKGGFGVSTVPGLELINDKEFYIYVEDLIRLYLDEAPILPNIPAQSLGRFSPRRITPAAVFQNLDRWVIKGANGRGGKQVWLGHRLSPAQACTLRERIRKKPSAYIAQKYTPLSTLLEHHVDLRLHSIILPGSEIISPTPWGRAMPIAGDGKINLSNQGMLSLVLIAPEKSAS